MARLVLVLNLLLDLMVMVEAGTHLDEPWFRWRDGVVPFYFQDMREADQEFVRSAMKKIEEETCLRFKEQEGPLKGHHLLVKTQGHGSCLGGNRKSRFSATVGAVKPARTQVKLQSFFQLADSPRCIIESRGGLLHELFHVFGIMHEQKRSDRDRYVRVLKEHIQDHYEYAYEKCPRCNNFDIPFDCDSFMLYGTETFSTGKPTMVPVNDTACDLRWVGPAFDLSRNGPDGASKWDWETLRRVAKTLCSQTENRERGNAKQKGKNRGSSEPKLCSKLTSTGGSTRAQKLMDKITDKICRNSEAPNQNNNCNNTNNDIPSSTLEKATRTSTIKTSTTTSTTTSSTERYEGSTEPPKKEEWSKLKNFIQNSSGDFKKILTKIATVLENKTSASSTTSSPQKTIPTTMRPTGGRSPKAEHLPELGRVRTDNVKITWFSRQLKTEERRKSFYEDTFSK